MCCVIDCSTSKSYNFKGLKPKYCGLHKLDGMINTKHELCTENECDKQASYGLVLDNLRIKCKDHKTNEMINLKTKNIKCKDDFCNIARYNYDGYCSLCCKLSNANQDDITEADLQNISKKEYNILRFLQNNFTHKIYWNKQITGIYKKPDFRIDLRDFQIIIENDEYQHIRYDKKEEIERLDNIYNHLNIPLYIIRFNPDRYINNDVLVNGCFSKNIVCDTTEWINRLDKLKDTINECITKGKCEKYEIIYLFYNIL